MYIIIIISLRASHTHWNILTSFLQRIALLWLVLLPFAEFRTSWKAPSSASRATKSQLILFIIACLKPSVRLAKSHIFSISRTHRALQAGGRLLFNKALYPGPFATWELGRPWKLFLRSLEMLGSKASPFASSACRSVQTWSFKSQLRRHVLSMIETKRLWTSWFSTLSCA